MSALEGFVTGFANVMASNILDRKKEARDYFNKQVEYARTTGLQNRQRVREQADAALSLARQLEQAGLPKDIIVAQINQNPEGIGDLYNEVEKLRSTREMTPEAWREFYQITGNLRNEGEDLATFISRTYDPISQALSDPTYEDDPEGTIWATMMGYNAMDRARAELGKTEVAEGLTAEQLIRYGDSRPQRGEAVVTRNYAALPQERGGGTLSSSDTRFVRELVEEVGNRVLGNEGSIDSVSSEGRQQIIDLVKRTDPSVPTEDVERLVDVYLDTRGGRGMIVDPPNSPVETLPVTPPNEGSSGASSASSPPPSASASIQEEFGERPPVITLPTDGKTLTFVKDNGDGTSIFIDQDGIEHELNNDAVRSYYRQ